MKRSLLITIGLFLCLGATTTMAQSNDNEDQVVKISQAMHRAHRPGQVLVKFKDDSSIEVKKQASGRMRASSTAMQNAIQKLGITDMEQLMPVGGKIKVPANRRVRGINGKPIEDPDMSKLYLVKFDTQRIHHVDEAVEALSQLDEVEFAEPNYLVFALGSPATNAVQETPANEGVAPAPFTPNDPMYPQQWGPAAINLPQFWGLQTQNVLGRRPVIAILDTGVDISHPDLKDNIWTNTKELEGAAGEDDDQNGYADDVHGWDCVN